MTTQTPQVPALVTLPAVELVAAGTWQLSTGDATFTKADLASAVDAAQCPAVGQPRIKIGHDDPRFTPGDGEPAIGRVTNLALGAEGNMLTGDLAGMPGWLGTIAPSAFPQRSIEGCWDFSCQIGHLHPFVITAVALLGVTGPGVGVLEDLGDVAALYGVAAAAVPKATGRPFRTRATGGSMDPVKAAATTTEDVRRNYYATAPFTQWITEIQLDPPQLIICDDMDASVWRVPYTAGSDGDVTFGDPVRVQVEYVDAPADKAAAAAAVQAGFRALVAAAKADPEQQRMRREARAKAIPYQKTGTSTSSWSAATAQKNLGSDPTADDLRAAAAWSDPDGTDTAKSSYKLWHHFVSADGTPGDASVKACTSAIGVLNGGMGGADIPDGDRQAVYAHLAHHLADAGVDAPELTSASAGQPEASAAHGSFTGTHSHAHSAMGAQGGDATHEHEHAHDGDASHGHVHGAAASTTKGAGVDFTTEQLAKLRDKLGKGDDDEITPDELVEAFTASAPAAAGRRAPLPAGAMIVEESAWKDLQDRVAAGERQEKRRQVEERDTVIAAAVRDGKFPPARREHWASLWNANPESTREVLASLQKNVVPVGDVGSPGAGDGDVDEEYRSLFGDPAKR